MIQPQSLSLPAAPPPVPRPRKPFFKRPWVIVMLGGMGALAFVIGSGVFFMLTASDFTPTDSQRACVVTADSITDYFDFPPDPRSEGWICSKYIDGTHDIDYIFDSSHEDAPYINCTLTIEHGSSDATGVYLVEWQGFKLGLKTSGYEIELVPDDQMFRWGDASRFVFLETEGERYGFAFHGRKGSKVFFLTMAGAYWEDSADFDGFLRPFLARFEQAQF